MELYILNKDFEIVGMIDDYISVEWARRYYEPGDFVIKIPATIEMVSLLKSRYFIAREDDDMICQIEKREIITDEDSGNTLTISGRSIEKLLAQRIIWQQSNSQAGETAEEFVRRLVKENVVEPCDEKRKIPGMKLGELKGFHETIEKQITGDNLLTAVTEICKTYGYGFRVTMDESGDLVFEVYKGVDRSYTQEENPYVIFSQDFENISNTSYEYDESTYTNVALVGGEGEGSARKYQTVGDAAGMDRYEMFVDARDISSNEGEIQAEAYNELLKEKGREQIAENTYTENYEGELETGKTYRYKIDYDVGDIVQAENELGISAAPRITEVIESHNGNGHKIVPTFEGWEVQ